MPALSFEKRYSTATSDISFTPNSTGPVCAVAALIQVRHVPHAIVVSNSCSCWKNVHFFDLTSTLYTDINQT